MVEKLKCGLKNTLLHLSDRKSGTIHYTFATKIRDAWPLYQQKMLTLLPLTCKLTALDQCKRVKKYPDCASLKFRDFHE